MAQPPARGQRAVRARGGAQAGAPGAIKVIVNGTPGGWNPSQSLAYSSDINTSGYPLDVQEGGKANIYVNGHVDPVTGNFVSGAPSGASLSPEELDMTRDRLGYLNANYDTPGWITGVWHDIKDLVGAASPLLSADQIAEKASIGNILASTAVDTSVVYDESGTHTMQGAGPIWNNVIDPVARGVVAAQQFMFTPHPTLVSSRDAQLAGLGAFADEQWAVATDRNSSFFMRALAANSLADTRQLMGGVHAMPTTNADIAGLVLNLTPFAELKFGIPRTSQIGEVGTFSKIVGGRIGSTEMSGIARALRQETARQSCMTRPQQREQETTLTWIQTRFIFKAEPRSSVADCSTKRFSTPLTTIPAHTKFPG